MCSGESTVQNSDNVSTYIKINGVSAFHCTVGSFFNLLQGCRSRSHDDNESPKSDLLFITHDFRSYSQPFLFYAWHLCLAVITYRVLFPLHVGTLLFPFVTLHAVPGVNHFSLLQLRILSIHCFFFGSDLSTFLLCPFVL
jgi:hypothetical protein